MNRLSQYVRQSLAAPRETLSRGQRWVRRSWELTAYCWHQLTHQRAEGMAAELTYRTIFSLIPVVVLGLVTFRVVGGLDDVQEQVEEQLFSFFGVPEVPVSYGQNLPDGQSEALVETTDSIEGTVQSVQTDAVNRADSNESAVGDDDNRVPNPDGDVETEASRREARASIRRTLREVTFKVSSLDFKSIGVFGLILFIYAAVALADSVEYLFNRIYDAPASRPVHLRLAIHWSIITLGSGLLSMSLYLSGRLVDWFNFGPETRPQILLVHALSILASAVLLFLLYALMPNTYVNPRAAAIGAVVGALLWEAAKFGFQIYVAKAVPYSAIYGSIGLIPLFLFWIYLTWLIVIFGLIVTYTLQTFRGRRLVRESIDEPAPVGDPDWMLAIMAEMGSSFVRGESLNNQTLADRLGLSSRVTHDMAHKLVEAGLLRRVLASSSDEESLVLAKPAKSIPIAEVLKVAHHWHPESDHPAWLTIADLKTAQRTAAGERTLADITAAGPDD